jgi:hypothetical protein
MMLSGGLKLARKTGDENAIRVVGSGYDDGMLGPL